jgi:hypothetical protein
MHILQTVLITVLQKISSSNSFSFFLLLVKMSLHILVSFAFLHVLLLLLLHFVFILLFYRQSDVEYTEHLHALERDIRTLEEYKIHNMDHLNQLLRQERWKNKIVFLFFQHRHVYLGFLVKLVLWTLRQDTISVTPKEFCPHFDQKYLKYMNWLFGT